MFDIRRPVKIFVANGEVRYGTRVDNGFFPVFSVELIDEAKLLTEIVPWACTDSLESYARRLEEMSSKTLTEKYVEARKRGIKHSGDLALDANVDSEMFLSKLALEQEIRGLYVELGPSARDIEQFHDRDHLYPESTKKKRALLRAKLAEHQELVKATQKPNPIALAIMGASEED